MKTKDKMEKLKTLAEVYEKLTQDSFNTYDFLIFCSILIVTWYIKFWELFWFVVIFLALTFISLFASPLVDENYKSRRLIEKKIYKILKEESG
jgi:ABC-type bacteriocin/lantibiotic exporter with double-glycine peptidase domain